jgi:hypothetical protein
MRDDID